MEVSGEAGNCRGVGTEARPLEIFGERVFFRRGGAFFLRRGDFGGKQRREFRELLDISFFRGRGNKGVF